MALKNIASGGGDFEQHPTGSYIARLVRMIEIGTQDSLYQGQVKRTRKVILSFESEALMKEGEYAGKPFMLTQRMTLSMHEKAALRKMVEGWRGKSFSDSEAKAYDLSKLAGKACQVSVIHNAVGDKTYANIQSVSMLRAGTTPPAQVNPTIVFDIDAPDMEVFKTLTEKTQALITESPEWKKRTAPKAAETSQGSMADVGSDIDSDDIPF